MPRASSVASSIRIDPSSSRFQPAYCSGEKEGADVSYTHHSLLFALWPSPHLSPRRLTCPWEMPHPIPSTQAISSTAERGKVGKIRLSKRSPAPHAPKDTAVYLAVAPLHTQPGFFKYLKRFNIRIYHALHKTRPGGTKETTRPEGPRAPRTRNPQQQQVEIELKIWIINI